MDADFTIQSVGGVPTTLSDTALLQCRVRKGHPRSTCFPDGSLRVRPSLSTEKMFFDVFILRLSVTVTSHLQ